MSDNECEKSNGGQVIDQQNEDKGINVQNQNIWDHITPSSEFPLENDDLFDILF